MPDSQQCSKCLSLSPTAGALDMKSGYWTAKVVIKHPSTLPCPAQFVLVPSGTQDDHMFNRWHNSTCKALNLSEVRTRLHVRLRAFLKCEQCCSMLCAHAQGNTIPHVQYVQCIAAWLSPCAQLCTCPYGSVLKKASIAAGLKRTS